MVRDNDGSAFITKAEFDSLKNNFQTQIDNYNNSIDSKIDGAIAAYLSGVKVSGGLTLLYNPTASYTFTNSMRGSEQKDDKGITNLQHNREAGFYGCTGATAQPEVWEGISESYLAIGSTYDWTNTTTNYKASVLIGSCQWQSTEPSSTKYLGVSFDTNKSYIKTSPLMNSDPKQAILDQITNLGFEDSKYTPSEWAAFLSTILRKMFQNMAASSRSVTVKCKNVLQGGGTVIGAPGIGNLSAALSRVNSEHMFTLYDPLSTGRSWGINLNNSVPSLTKWYDTISILNTSEIQNFTYKNGSGSTTSDSAWNDISNIGYTLDPDADFSQQVLGTRKPNNTTDTGASTYHRFLASQIKVADGAAWSSNHQLGTNTYESTIRCFNEDCTLAKGAEQKIEGSTLKFDRTGYYMNSGALVTKDNNYVTTGDIKYTNLIWASTVYNTNQVKLDSFSNVAGENVYLGGGIPLAQSPTENTGIKVKLDYEVKKLDGSALTAADGNMNIKLEISNKQFSNGAVASGAVSHDTFTTTVNNTSAIGHWDSAAFDMETKAKLWLNAYVTDKQGYNVIIKNINVQ